MGGGPRIVVTIGAIQWYSTEACLFGVYRVDFKYPGGMLPFPDTQI